jgi:hypothetical protein
MFRFAEHDVPSFFRHHFDISDLAQPLEYYILGETIGKNRFVSGVADPDNLGELFLAEISCKCVSSLASDRNQVF